MALLWPIHWVTERLCAATFPRGAAAPKGRPDMPRYPSFKYDPDAPHPLVHPPAPRPPPAPPAPPARTRAAEYVRMSTDFQTLSIANQRAAIAQFANDNGIDVVRTYADEGISGLSIRGREGLQSLLSDIAIGKADFTVVLVYDVSRWGRFQDADESAHYEFLCRAAGIRVEYRAEAFRNDGTPMAGIMKGLKRIMAGEYSRELSEKVFAAKCRMARLGFRQGGRPGFGLRRAVVDAAGHVRAVLGPGQHKALQSDRVTTVAGPPEELAVVRWVMEQVAYAGRKPGPITRDLNRRGVAGPRGNPWTTDHIHSMLGNENYIGNLVYNRKSYKLHVRWVPNPPERWVRTENAFPAFIDPALFRDAQEAMARWATRTSNQDALKSLRELLTKHGKLSAKLINETPGMPKQVFYEERFGGLTRAYAEVGYVPDRDYEWLDGYTKRRRQIDGLRTDILRLLQERSLPVRPASRTTLLCGADHPLRVAIMLGRWVGPEDSPRWRVQPHNIKPRPDWVLSGCLGADRTTIVRYWLTPATRVLTLGGWDWRHRDRHTATEPGPLLDIIATGRRPDAPPISARWPKR